MTSRLYLALMGLSLCGLLALAGCHPPGPQAARTNAVTNVSPPAASDPDDAKLLLAPTGGAEYAGDVVCADCHLGEARSHRVSRHALTIRSVSLQSDSSRFRTTQVVTDILRGVRYREAVQRGECVTVINTPQGSESTTARYALGGGRYGSTYICQTTDGKWWETRLTYYTQLHRWDFTPALEPTRDPRQSARGMPLTRLHLQFCFSCHVTTLQLTPNGEPTSTSHLNIGCERCHGPGRAHAGAARRTAGMVPAPSAVMERLHSVPRERAMAVCRDCHSAPEGMPVSPDTSQALSRFASTALEQSRCYRSSGTLSCMTCHDAHTLAAKPAGYEAACLRCHGTAKPELLTAQAGRSSLAEQRVSGPVCRINPRHGCIKCHMPQQNALARAPIQFHNHWIGIYDGGKIR